MENSKLKIILISVAVIIMIICISMIFRGGKTIIQEDLQIKDENYISAFNEENNLYEITYEPTGEIVYVTNNETEAELQLEFYKTHPDYRAEPPTSPDVMEGITDNTMEEG